MRDDSIEDTALNEQWYDQHPVVSTVLWLIGGISKSPELSSPKSENGGKIPRNNSRLSWADEHDGEIAEYIGPEPNRSEKKEKKASSMMPRQTSLAHVGTVGGFPSTDSGDDNVYLRSSNSDDIEANKRLSRHEEERSLPSGARGGGGGGGDEMVDENNMSPPDESTLSPQWGWYVSTTPPQELYGKEKSRLPE